MGCVSDLGNNEFQDPVANQEGGRPLHPRKEGRWKGYHEHDYGRCLGTDRHTLVSSLCEQKMGMHSVQIEWHIRIGAGVRCKVV